MSPLMSSDSSPKVSTAYRIRNRTTIGRTRALASEIRTTVATRLNGSRKCTGSSTQAAPASASASTIQVSRT